MDSLKMKTLLNHLLCDCRELFIRLNSWPFEILKGKNMKYKPGAHRLFMNLEVGSFPLKE